VHETITSRIRELSPQVSARIAAGEVLEQPASAVRELLDNAIDAGASRIRVEVREGGLVQIAVSDDGCGMGREELALAIRKHATSKISELEDLENLTSLGFRGEALAAMAAVSRMRIVSDDGSGAHEAQIEGGAVRRLRPAAAPRGTLVELTDLFYNTPARRAFLHGPLAETRAIRRVLVERMLAFPGLAFEFQVDGETRLVSAAGGLRDRVRDLFGEELAGQLMEGRAGHVGMEAAGLFAPVHRSATTRRDQYLALNGRPIVSPALSQALLLGYGDRLPAGRFPVVFLHMRIDPALVNVNVHPAKREVRFRDERAVFDLVRAAVRAALAKNDGFARSAPLRSFGPEAGADAPPGETLRVAEPALFANLGAAQAGADPFAAARPVRETAGPGDGPFAGCAVAGFFMDNYWVLDGGTRVFLVDQHAAHERVMYERYKTALSGAGGIARQGLLVPLVFRPSPAERELLGTWADEVARAGFLVEDFGPDTCSIQEVPAGLQGDLTAALREVLAVLSGEGEGGRGRPAADRFDRMLKTLACKSAIRAGDHPGEAGFLAILRELGGLENPHSCAHGRPAVVEISRQEVEAWFARR
jgi:DNA mismatch repair protein MutL